LNLSKRKEDINWNMNYSAFEKREGKDKLRSGGTNEERERQRERERERKED
jgi:hypothetical protein